MTCLRSARLPPLEELVERGELLLHGAARVVLERLGDELAVAVVVLDPLGDHGELHAAHDVDVAVVLVVRQVVDDVVGVVEDHVDLVIDRLVVEGRIRRRDVVAALGHLVDLDRWAVPVGVGEQLGRLAEVEDREEVLPVVGPQPGASADDLLELSERLDPLVQDSRGRSVRRRRWS